MTFPARIMLAPATEMRSSARRVINFDAFVRDCEAIAIKVRIMDLTAEGCRLSGSQALEPKAEIWLKIPGLAPLNARVAWSSSEEAGCEFHHPLHPATLAGLLQSARRIAKGVFGPVGAKPANS